MACVNPIRDREARGRHPVPVFGGSNRSLLGLYRLARRPIDGVFKLVAAGLTRPHVTNAIVGKMLRPFGCGQNSTALRALIYCTYFHRSLPTALRAVTGAASPNQETVAGARQYLGDRQVKSR